VGDMYFKVVVQYAAESCLLRLIKKFECVPGGNFELGLALQGYCNRGLTAPKLFCKTGTEHFLS
jgi:hypothetical protein